MKKIASIVLALVLVLAMAAPAMAAEKTHTITITNAVSGHTYEAYQIFAGDLSMTGDNQVLSSIVWGTNVNGATILSALKADTTVVDTKTETSEDGTATETNVTLKMLFADATTAIDVADVLADNNNNALLVERFAEIVEANLTGNPAGTSTQQTSPYTISVTGDGYYLVKDKDNSVPSDDAYTKYILQVVDDVNVAAKSDAPEVDKDIVEGTEEVEAVDKNIGDTINFRITGTVSSRYDDYDSYKYVFHDTVSAGLTPNLTYDDTDATKVTSGITVKVGTTDITSKFQITYTNGTLTISCADLKEIASINKDSKIVVEYSATLNENAVIGYEGNPNKVKLEYSNDPNWNGEGTEPTGNTPEDEVLVFTYELDVTKVDGENTATKLKDAEFVLYRGTDADKEYATADTNGKLTGWVKTEADATVLKTNDKGLFVVIGLDAGTYYLHETKAPTGYNILTEDITVIITATVDASEEDPSLEALTIKVDNGEAVSGETVQTKGNGTEDATDDEYEYTGRVKMDVENKKGTILPETGGIGTTIFYVAGGLLMVGALVLLITKRKVESK